MNLCLLWSPPSMAGVTRKMANLGHNMAKHGRFVNVQMWFKRVQNGNSNCFWPLWTLLGSSWLFWTIKEKYWLFWRPPRPSQTISRLQETGVVTRIGTADFFVSVDAMKSIDKRLSAWNRLEKTHSVVRISTYAVIWINHADLSSISAYAHETA